MSMRKYYEPSSFSKESVIRPMILKLVSAETMTNLSFNISEFELEKI
jgi:hypothetical protein